MSDERLCSEWRVNPDSMEEMRKWGRLQPSIPPDLPDEYHAQFLHACYHNVDRAKKALVAYFKLKASSPEFFSGRTVDDEDLKKVFKVCRIGLLPTLTTEGYSVICGRLVDTRPSVFDNEQSVKLLFMVMDLVRLERPASKGVVFLEDLSGYGFRHLFKLSISTVRSYFHYIQDACPIRAQNSYFINTSSMVPHLLFVAKPFMYKEHADKMIFYTGAEFNNLSKILPLKDIPIDLGGEGPSMESIQEETIRKLKYHEDWFKMDESLVYRKK